MMPLVRTRLALGLVSLGLIGLELALMRALSLRLWSHFAYMVISVALLGFGASGTAITLIGRAIHRRPQAWLCGLCLAFSASVPLCWRVVGRIRLLVQSLTWDLSQVGNVVAVELLMFVPFLLAGAVVGVALMDRPARIGGHYAANLIGSGLGAVVSVLLMFVVSTEGLFVVTSAAGCVAGMLLIRWRSPGWAVAGLAVAAVVAASAGLSGREPSLSPYKMLAQVRTWPGTRQVYRAEGPLGRIDVVAGASLHYTPALSLQYAELPPPHVLLIVDGDQTSAVYDVKHPQGWGFMDHTTAAVAYHLRQRPRVCVIGAGGGADIGLALFHRSEKVVALEMNHQIIEAMTGPLAGLGGTVYRAPGVCVVNAEARGYFGSTRERFDVIQLPALDAFGASGAGLHATQESYLYTVESLGSMLDRLGENGVLSVTRWVSSPPRGELRMFDTAALALRRRGLDPARHLVMIRSYATATVLAFFPQPIRDEDADAIRAFCNERGFDLCCLPGLTESEVNLNHRLDRPYYVEATRALLGAGREEFLADYAFRIAATTDDRPYFFHSFRWRAWPVLAERLGGASRAFLEVSYLMLVAALVQAVVLALVLIVLPLALRRWGPQSRCVGIGGPLPGKWRKEMSDAEPRMPGPGVRGQGPGVSRPLKPEPRALNPETPAALAYFLLLGAGFMLVEMGFLQRLILYLAHPVYSAAVVIASFLIFAGVGSGLSGRWRVRAKRLVPAAAAVVACVSAGYLLWMGDWLRLTRGLAVPWRFVIAAGTIAPLAVAMGHMFPTGLRQVAGARRALVPWAWAVNGFASVVATVAAPLLAMEFGFSRVLLLAVACYLAAGLLGRALPD